MRHPAGRAWLLVALWSGVILVGTSLPARHLPPLGAGRDKVAHLLAYAVLGAVVASALSREHPQRTFLLILLMSVGWGAAFGLMDEWHQRLLQRTCSWNDWVADVIGATAGAAGFITYRRQRMESAQWRKHGG